MITPSSKLISTEKKLEKTIRAKQNLENKIKKFTLLSQLCDKTRQVIASQLLFGDH